MIAFRAAQIFLDFLAMACFASVASFQAKWTVGPCTSHSDPILFPLLIVYGSPAGLSGFAVFVSVISIILSSLMLVVPVVYEKLDKLARFARALREVRVAFIFNGIGTVMNLLIAYVSPPFVSSTFSTPRSSFITTISVSTQPGCKDPSKDPHAKDRDDGFKNGLPGWCRTKRAGAVFFWLAFIFWTVSFVYTVIDWRSGKASRPRDPPFIPPRDDDDTVGDDESAYDRDSTIGQAIPEPNEHSSTPYSAPPISSYDPHTSAHQPSGYSSPPSRPSMDVYGAFSDPVPSGYSNGDPYSHNSNLVSKTMQYADPYAAVRANITSKPPRHEPDGAY